MLLKLDNNNNPFWLRLTNVLYVPTLRMNIMSVIAMDSSDMRVAFVHGRCDLSDATTHKYIASGQRHNDGLYWVRAIPKRNPSSVGASANTVATANPEQLWHARLGHVHSKALKTILSDDSYKADPRAVPATVDCNDCTVAKGTRVPHYQPLVKPGDAPGTCVFMDHCGPMRSATWGGARYFIVFIDGATRYIWHEALAAKSDATDAIMRFVAKFDTAFTQRIRRLHSDNGGEF